MAIYGKKELDFIFTGGLKTDELGKQEQKRIYQYDCEQREMIARACFVNLLNRTI